MISPLRLMLSQLLLILPLAAVAQPVPAEALALAKLVDSEGYLALPEGFSGQIDPSGYRLASSSGGIPRFLPAGAELDQRWGEEFGLAHGCDGPVLAIVAGAGGEIYFGGGFNHCDDVRANFVVRYEPGSGTWSPLGSGSGNGTNAPVSALAFADGILYAGGSFTQSNAGEAVEAMRIARWDTATGQWSALGHGSGNGANAPVRALILAPDGDLYAGGEFTEVNVGAGVGASRVARWSQASQSWSALPGTGGEGAGDAVNALRWFDGELHVGGAFNDVNVGAPVPARRIARWNPVNGWSPLGNIALVGAEGEVHSLETDGATLFVGGRFQEVTQTDGSALLAVGVARWNPVPMAWSSLGEGFSTPLGQHGYALSLRRLGDELLVGGVFALTGGTVTAPNVARWNIAGQVWSSLDGSIGSGTGGRVTALEVHDGRLYVGGDYSGVVSQGLNLTTGNVSAWTLADGLPSVIATAEGNGIIGRVEAITVMQGDLYVGGVFELAGGQAANGIARWDGKAWSMLGQADQQGGILDVHALAGIGDNLYAGGGFHRLEGPAGPLNVGSIARWNVVTESWFPLGHDGGFGTDGIVLSLASYNGELYVGGLFSTVNTGADITATNIARWNPQAEQWSAVGHDSGEGLQNAVYTLLVAGTDLYAGGIFVEANLGAPILVNRIARWNGLSWSAVGSSFGVGVNGSVLALATDGRHLYTAGNFSQANVGAPIAANRIARWNLQTGGWSALGDGITGDGVFVRSVAVTGNGVFVGGRFAAVDGPAQLPADNIARWDTQSGQWSPVGSGIEGSLVESLLAHDGQLYAGGDFRLAGDKSALSIARYATDPSLFADSFE